MTGGIGTTSYGYYTVTNGQLGAGMLASVDGPFTNDTISYYYDALGRTTNRAINGVAQLTTYDALSRVTVVTNALGEFTNTYVDTTPRLASVKYPNGQGTVFSYFSVTYDERLQEIWHTNGSGSTVSKFDYTYDPDGEITTWTRQADANTPTVLSMGYDPGDQLLSAVLTTNTVAGAVLKQYLYGYDPAGNRLTETIENATNNPVTANGASYNNLNELTSVSSSSGPMLFAGSLDKAGAVTVGGSAAVMYRETNFTGFANVSTGTNVVSLVASDIYGNARTNKYQIVVTNNGVAETLTFDPDGNELSVVSATSTNAYQWDAANRLVSITGGTNQSQFTYDGLGRRVQDVELQNGAAVSTNTFLWCGQELCEQRDMTGGTVTRRFFGQGEQISGTNYFFTRDHLGSIREVTDGSGTIRARYDYDPYGRRTKIQGDLDADFAFTGHYYHSASGLCLTLYRAYDPGMGRWLNRDPIAERGGLNLYRAMNNNPINNIDPLGLWNLWAPWTWGVSDGIGTSLGNSLNPFDSSAGWSGFSLETSSEADAAFLDGVNPFGNPLANAGLYDPCDKSLQASKTIGTLTRDAELTLAIPNIGTWIKNPFLYEIGSTTVPADVYDAMYGLNAIEKGSYLTSTYGLGGTLGLNLEAIGTGEFSTTIWTGGTPGARLLLLGAGQAADSYFVK